MKTPEEIKKGLDACWDKMSVCDEVCPYEGTKPFPRCREELLGDAMAYIQQLEMMAKPNEQIRWERDIAMRQLEEMGVGFGEKVCRE